MFAVYAWMRLADDLVDEAPDAKAASAKLDAFAAQTESLFSGDVPEGNPMWRALAEVRTHIDLPRHAFEAMLDGQRWDIEGRPITTEAELEAYCERVASSVGVICVHVWGFDNDEAPELARRRGIAFQLTNMLRDVGEDLAMGRCYLPLESFGGSMHRDMLKAWHPPEPCSKFIVHWAGRAIVHYEASAGLDRMVQRRCRRTLRTMTRIYQGILNQIIAVPKRSVLGPRARISTIRKVFIAASAGCTLR
jgi:phytoene synthase